MWHVLNYDYETLINFTNISIKYFINKNIIHVYIMERSKENINHLPTCKLDIHQKSFRNTI